MIASPRSRVLVICLALAAASPALAACQAREGAPSRAALVPEVAAAGSAIGVDPRAARWTWEVAGPLGVEADGDGQIVMASDGNGPARVTVLRDLSLPRTSLDGVPIRDIADEVARSVRDRVRQERVVGPSTPDETWERRTGDCTEIADLTAELLRRRGVEARVAGGVAAHGDELRWHAWVEYRDERWASLDPTLNQHPVDVTHVRLDHAARASELARLDAFIAAAMLRPWRDSSVKSTPVKIWA